MAIRDDHLHDDADGAFPVIEDNNTEVSELNDKSSSSEYNPFMYSKTQVSLLNKQIQLFVS